MARLDSFLRLVVEQSASDLHLHAGNEPIIRHDGELMSLPFRPLSDVETERFLFEILSTEQREELGRNQQVDLMYVLEGAGRFRANIFRQNKGFGGVFRIIPNRLPTLKELAFPPALKRLTELQNGLILITGPTGSGKTTTLAAMVNEINEASPRHVITVEDPIEYIHGPKKSLITQRQIGEHTDSFPSALRSALRECPDVLVVGEMRDLETVQIALSAAETGVLVFGTLHTNSAPKALNRIMDVFPDGGRDQVRSVLSTLLRGVVAQRLCKKSSGDGRVAVLEILLQSFAVSSMIRDNKTHQIAGYLETAGSDEAGGMQSLDLCLQRYLASGFVDVEDAAKIARYPDTLRKMALEMEKEV